MGKVNTRKFCKVDIMLLYHEEHEKALMDRGLNYYEAHRLAHDKFPWSDFDDRMK